MCVSVEFVVDGQVVFGGVVGKIAAAFFLVVAKLFLGFTASEPS